jgi:hypothetical protein
MTSQLKNYSNSLVKTFLLLVAMAHTRNLSYSGGGDQED